MNKIRVLFVPSDNAGVGHYRSIWPAQEIQKKYSDDFFVEINLDFVNDINYYKSFDIIHFHRQLGNYNGMQSLISELRKSGVIIIMDIDDYWVPPKTHPMYLAAIKEKLPEKITSSFKMVDYVTTTTDIFGKHIKKYNPNVFVIPNGIDMSHRMWRGSETSKNSDKLRVSWIGGSCFDNQTEILTDNGFKFFKDLEKTDKVACLNPNNNNLEFITPNGYIKVPYKGMLNCGENNIINYAVTPNHNMYVSVPKSLTKKELDFKLIQSKNIHGKNLHFKKDAVWNGLEIKNMIIPKIFKKESEFILSISSLEAPNLFSETRNEKYFNDLSVDMDLWLKFFGFWMAEGWTTSTEGIYQVGVSQKKNNGYLEEIFDTLKKLGFNPTYTKDLCQVRVFDKRLWNYLSQFGKAEDKFVPKEILELSSRQLGIFLDWYLKGDGSQEKDHVFFDKRTNKKGLVIGETIRKTKRQRGYTVSKKLADNIQEICLKLGLISTITNRGLRNSIMKDGRIVNAKFDAYVISIGSDSIRSKKTPLLKSENQYQLEYDDYVYCVEVPNHIIYVRRNGKTMWCGNSHLNDLEILRPSMNMLHNDVKIRDKYQLVMCGYDVRGFMTEIGQNGETISTRKIKPEETVWNKFEEIFTDNYNKYIIPEEYKKFLLKYSNEEYKDDIYKENYIRRWTLPLTRYGEHYDYCDVCLAPLDENIFNEVKSELKIIEAGLKKKVLIAQSFSVYKDLISNGVNGILIDKKSNVRGWYEAIKMLINNPEKAKELSQNLYDFVISKYTLEIVTKNRVDFYKKIIKEKEVKVLEKESVNP